MSEEQLNEMQEETAPAVETTESETDAPADADIQAEEPIVSGIDSGLTAIGERTEVPIA